MFLIVGSFQVIVYTYLYTVCVGYTCDFQMLLCCDLVILNLTTLAEDGRSWVTIAFPSLLYRAGQSNILVGKPIGTSSL